LKSSTVVACCHAAMSSAVGVNAAGAVGVGAGVSSGCVVAVEGVVVGGFLLWHVLGAGSSDDGYILGMARVAPHAQYMINYFRWFGSPEDPFGWYYNVLALMRLEKLGTCLRNSTKSAM